MMTPFALSGLLILLTAIPLGLLVAYGHASKPINRAFAVFYGVMVSIWGAGALIAGATRDPALSLLAWRISHVGVIFIPVTYYHFTCLYCGIKKPRALAAAYLFGAVSVAMNFVGWPFVGKVRYVFDSYYTAVGGPLYFPFVCAWLGYVVAAQKELWRRYQRENDVLERARTRLVVVGTLIGFGGGSLNFLPILGIDIYPWGNFAVPIAAVTQIYAVYAYKLMDVEIAIRKTLVYSTLAALITATYLVAVLVMEKWFQGFLGYRSLVATIIVAFLISIGFNPLRDRIQAFLDRALFKGTMAELAAQRERLLTEVQKAEQMKAVATLAAGLAHEVKNPLASIKTFTECLDQKHSDPAFLEKFKRIVGGEVERINLIVQQLLDFAKPVPPKLTPVELGHLLDTTLELLNSEILQRHVEVKRVYGTNHVVLGDPQQLEQVFLNLLLNSLQAMNGSGSLEIRTDLEASELRVTIRDNGTGIDPKLLPHVFEPFFTTKETGTGLGLAVAQGIVTEHGGRVVVTSQPGTGTTVQVYLPAAV